MNESQKILDEKRQLRIRLENISIVLLAVFSFFDVPCNPAGNQRNNAPAHDIDKVFSMGRHNDGCTAAVDLV